MMNATFTSYGIAAALAEIDRRNSPHFDRKTQDVSPRPDQLSFAAAERRLAETMKPARLGPLNSVKERGSHGALRSSVLSDSASEPSVRQLPDGQQSLS